MTPDIPPVEIATARKSFWSRVSVVWLVPLAALLIALGVAWQYYIDRGPLITITFEEAAGIAVNKTELRYRDVRIGVVEAVRLGDGLQSVDVDVRLTDKQAYDFVDKNVEFWLVRAEVSTQGVSGIDTLLSGVYIAAGINAIPLSEETRSAVWTEVVPTSLSGRLAGFLGLTELVHKTVGKDRPMIDPSGEIPLEIKLFSRGGTLDGNSPILYRGVEVGRIGPTRLLEDGSGVEADAVIYAAHQGLITTNTRFWSQSGFDVSVGLNGASLNVGSLASLIAGGVSLETFVYGGGLIESGSGFFEVHESRTEARASQGENPLVEPSFEEPVYLAAHFEGDFTGLFVGAPVELKGIAIGEVVSMDGYIDTAHQGGLRLQAVLRIDSARLGYSAAQDPAKLGPKAFVLDYLSREVMQGNLRAALVRANLLTGGQKVLLFEETAALPAVLDQAYDPYPLFPSAMRPPVDANRGVMEILSALPLADIGREAVSLLEGANASVLRANRILDTFASETGLGKVETILASVDEVLAQAAEANVIASITDALKTVPMIGEGLAESFKPLPALIKEASRILGTLSSGQIQTILANLERGSEGVANFLDAPGLEAVPQATLETLQSVEEAATLLSQSGLIEGATTTVRDVGTALSGLPQMIATAERAIGNFEDTSNVVRDARTAIRNVANAANAVADLARTIERQPNSLLFGR